MKTIRKPLLLAGTVAIASLLAGCANTGLLVTTTGTIGSGTDSAGVFGAGANLAGKTYTLTVLYPALGSSYYTDGTGNSASDIADPIQGVVTATVAGTSVTTALVNLTSATLAEDPYAFVAANSGMDDPGNFALVSQTLDCAESCVPYADLLTPFLYRLAASDSGTDTYSFTNAAGTATVSFTGTPTGIDVRRFPGLGAWPAANSGTAGERPASRGGTR